jgi:hypothetical protein
MAYLYNIIIPSHVVFKKNRLEISTNQILTVAAMLNFKMEQKSYNIFLMLRTMKVAFLPSLVSF